MDGSGEGFLRMYPSGLAPILSLFVTVCGWSLPEMMTMTHMDSSSNPAQLLLMVQQNDGCLPCPHHSTTHGCMLLPRRETALHPGGSKLYEIGTATVTTPHPARQTQSFLFILFHPATVHHKE